MARINLNDPMVQSKIREAYNAWRVTEEGMNFLDPRFNFEASKEIAKIIDETGEDEEMAYEDMYFFLKDWGVKVF